MKAKEKLYKSAYSPMFGVFVKITHAHTDSDGRWIFTCENKEIGLKDALFRKNELIRFTF